MGLAAIDFTYDVFFVVVLFSWRQKYTVTHCQISLYPNRIFLKAILHLGKVKVDYELWGLLDLCLSFYITF